MKGLNACECMIRLKSMTMIILRLKIFSFFHVALSVSTAGSSLVRLSVISLETQMLVWFSPWPCLHASPTVLHARSECHTHVVREEALPSCFSNPLTFISFKGGGMCG